MRDKAWGWIVFLALAVAVGCGPKRGTIGAVLGQTPDGELTIHDVPEGLAAEKAGLKVGDKILTINGKDVRAMDAEGVHKALSGEVGDKVKLTVVRGEEVIRVTLKRTPSEKWRGRRLGPQ